MRYEYKNMFIYCKLIFTLNIYVCFVDGKKQMLLNLRKILIDINSPDVQHAQRNIVALSQVAESALLDQFESCITALIKSKDEENLTLLATTQVNTSYIKHMLYILYISLSFWRSSYLTRVGTSFVLAIV